MNQNPLNHKPGHLVWVWVLLGALILGVGCSQGSDDEGNSSSSEPVKLVGDQTEVSQPAMHQPDAASEEDKAVPVEKLAMMPLKQPASAISQEVMTVISERFGEQESLLFLHSAHPEKEYVVVGFPGRLLVAPDTLPLEKVLGSQPPRVTVKVHPDAIASILANANRPSAAIMDSTDTLVGLVATEKTMLRLRRSAVVAAPQASENEASKKAAEAILAPASPTKESPIADSKPSAEGDSSPEGETPHGEAQVVETHEAVHADSPAKNLQKEDAPHTQAESSTPVGEDDAHSTAAATPPAADTHGVEASSYDDQMPTGIAFVDSAIKPMNYELKNRFWGWRPNDLVRLTDNVNHFQLGVLEVTRRTAVMLAQRISRTGITASFDPNLEKAMNWFMIKADRFWLPAAESKYRDGLEEWTLYRERLLKDEAAFFNRADNLIPLLTAYEALLGSCEENLVKAAEDDGAPVSYFSSDNYVYYTQGVISAMVTILEAVGYDFKEILVSRRADADLHHAIRACEHALAVDPIIVFNNSPSSVFANHRANLAAPVSHARFFLTVLIKTLST